MAICFAKSETRALPDPAAILRRLMEVVMQTDKRVRLIRMGEARELTRGGAPQGTAELDGTFIRVGG